MINYFSPVNVQIDEADNNLDSGGIIFLWQPFTTSRVIVDWTYDWSDKLLLYCFVVVKVEM